MNQDWARSLPEVQDQISSLPRSTSDVRFFESFLELSQALLDALASEDWERTEQLAERRDSMFRIWKSEVAGASTHKPPSQLQQKILSVNNALNTAARIRHDSMGSRLAVMGRGARAVGAYASNSQ